MLINRNNPATPRLRRRLSRGAVALTAAALTFGAVMPAHAEGPGSVIAWGFNNVGQLGDGTTTTRTIPVDLVLPVGAEVVDTAGGRQNHTLAVTSTGSVLAWGANQFGKLGDGTTTPSSSPVTVSIPALNPGETVTQVAAGFDHSLALTSDGRVLAWGYGGHGQMGDGTTTTSNLIPDFVSIPVGESVVAIAAGTYHNLALTSDGDVLAWGRNNFGALGDATGVNRNTPVFVGLPPGVDAIAIAANGDHSHAITDLGAVVRSWGWGGHGQMGNSTTTATNSTPVPTTLSILNPGETVTAISAGQNHVLAVTDAGRGLAWGENTFGKLGDGTQTQRTAPVLITLPGGVTLADVAGGFDHSIALTTDGRVLGFGYGGSGQMGDGTSAAINLLPTFATVGPFVTVSDISAGRYTNQAVAFIPPTGGVPIANGWIALASLGILGLGFVGYRRRSQRVETAAG